MVKIADLSCFFSDYRIKLDHPSLWASFQICLEICVSPSEEPLNVFKLTAIVDEVLFLVPEPRISNQIMGLSFKITVIDKSPDCPFATDGLKKRVRLIDVM